MHSLGSFPAHTKVGSQIFQFLNALNYFLRNSGTRVHACFLQIADLSAVLCVHRAKMIDGDGSDFYLDTHQVGSDADDE
jgi:hypothetical protein